MRIQAGYKRCQDSVRLLEQLENFEVLKQANVKIFLDSASTEDQKLLKLLSTSLGNHRMQARTQAMKIATLAAVFSMTAIAAGLTAFL